MDEKKVARLDEILGEITTLRNEAVYIVNELKNETLDSSKSANQTPFVGFQPAPQQNFNQYSGQNTQLNQYNQYSNFNQPQQQVFVPQNKKKVDTEKLISRYIIPILASILIFVGLISLAFMVDGRVGDALQVLVMYLFSGIFCVGGYKVSKSKARALGEGLLGCGIGALFITTYVTYAFYAFITQIVMIICMLMLATVFTIISEKHGKSVIRIIAQIGTIFPIFDLAFRGDVTTATCILAVTSVIMIILGKRNNYITVVLQNLMIQFQMLSLTYVIYREIRSGATVLMLIFGVLLLAMFGQNIYYYAKNIKFKTVGGRISTVLMLAFSFIAFLTGMNACISSYDIFLLLALAVSYIIVAVSLFKSRIGISDFFVLMFYSFFIVIFSIMSGTIGRFSVQDIIGMLPLILLIYLSSERKERSVLAYILLMLNFGLLLGNNYVSSYRIAQDFAILSVLWYTNYIVMFGLIVYDFFGKGKLFSFAKPIVTALNSWVISLSIPLIVSIFVSDKTYSLSGRNIIHFLGSDNGEALWLIAFIAVYIAFRHVSFLKKFNSFNLGGNSVGTEVIECFIALWGCVTLGILGYSSTSYAVLLQSMLALCVIALTVFSFKGADDLKSIYRYIKTLFVVSLVLRNILVGDYTGAVIGLVWLVLASILILCGFKYKTKEVRLYGLYLAIIAVIRLVLLDIPTNNSVMTVALYILGGIICFGIVLMYNKIEVRYKEETVNKEQ